MLEDGVGFLKRCWNSYEVLVFLSVESRRCTILYPVQGVSRGSFFFVINCLDEDRFIFCLLFMPEKEYYYLFFKLFRSVLKIMVHHKVHHP